MAIEDEDTTQELTPIKVRAFELLAQSLSTAAAAVSDVTDYTILTNIRDRAFARMGDQLFFQKEAPNGSIEVTEEQLQAYTALMSQLEVALQIATEPAHQEWYRNARHQTETHLKIRQGGDQPIEITQSTQSNPLNWPSRNAQRAQGKADGQ